MNRRVLTVCGCVIALLGTGLGAEDWPQWRGPDRFAVWHETGILERFPDDGLKVTWRVPIGNGFGGPAVADGRVFVTDWEEDPDSRTFDGTERVLALDEQTGKVLWTYSWGTTYRALMCRMPWDQWPRRPSMKSASTSSALPGYCGASTWKPARSSGIGITSRSTTPACRPLGRPARRSSTASS